MMRSSKLGLPVILFLCFTIVETTVFALDPSWWTQEVLLTTEAYGGISMQADQQGNLYIIENKFDQALRPSVYLYKYDPDGEPLIQDRRLTFSLDALQPDAALDRDGNIYLAWRDSRDGTTEIYYKKLDNNGQPLINDIRVTPLGGLNSLAPSIALDTNNDVHIVWHDDRDGNWEIYYTKLNGADGSTLVDDTRLTADVAYSFYPKIARIGNSFHVVWHDARSGNLDVYYTKLDNNGNTLIDDTALTTDLSSSLYPAIVADARNAHIVWQDNRDGNWEIYYEKLDGMNGNSLVHNLRLTNDIYDSVEPAIARDHVNDLHLAWADSRAGSLEVFYKLLDNNGNMLTSDTSLTPNAAPDVYRLPSVMVDSQQILSLKGTVHVAYQKDAIFPMSDTYFKKSYSTLSIDQLPRTVYRGERYLIRVSDPLSPNKSFKLVFAQAASTGIPLNDGRVFPLNPDALFFLSLIYPELLNIVSPGILNNQGFAEVQWAPSIDVPSGLYVFAAAFVYDQNGIGSFTRQQLVTIY